MSEIGVVRLFRMGESSGLALWIPANIVRKLDLKPGERVLLVEKDGKIVIVRSEEVVQNV
jgi:AbrB family looped-hinge helix DNA binding protein